MTARTLAIGIAALLSGSGALAAGEPAKGDSHQPTVRIIDKTTVIGDSDPFLWKKVLDLLPIRPERIEVLDLDSLSSLARQKLRGLDGFVLAGHKTIVVIRQGATLRQAELGDAVDRLVLASLVWHEMAHANGFGRARRARTGTGALAPVHLGRTRR